MYWKKLIFYFSDGLITDIVKILIKSVDILVLYTYINIVIFDINTR